MFTRQWWRKTVERMAKTAAQTLIYMIGSNGAADVANQNWIHLPWNFIAVSVTVMTLLSLASSILTTPLGPNPEDPSAA